MNSRLYQEHVQLPKVWHQNGPYLLLLRKQNKSPDENKRLIFKPKTQINHWKNGCSMPESRVAFSELIPSNYHWRKADRNIKGGGVKSGCSPDSKFLLNCWWLERFTPLEILQWNESKRREKWENPKPIILGQAEKHLLVWLSWTFLNSRVAEL